MALTLSRFDMIQQQGFTLNVWGNILMFVPLGMYVLFCMRERRLLKAVFYTMVISVVIEVLQFIFSRGATDIDDVLLNTCGGAIGAILFWIIQKKWVEKSKQQTVLSIISTVVGFPMMILVTLLWLLNM